MPLFRLTIDREVEEVGRVRPIVLPAKSSKVAAAIHLGEEDKRIRRERVGFCRESGPAADATNDY